MKLLDVKLGAVAGFLREGLGGEGVVRDAGARVEFGRVDAEDADFFDAAVVARGFERVAIDDAADFDADADVAVGQRGFDSGRGTRGWERLGGAFAGL